MGQGEGASVVATGDEIPKSDGASELSKSPDFPATRQHPPSADQTLIQPTQPRATPEDAPAIKPDGATMPDGRAGQTVPALPQPDSAALPAAEADIPAVWNVGDVILDTYEVKQVHGGGGMGLVYRMHHRGWNVDLAVKSPRPEYFTTEAHKESFVRECETWINLGLHPNIVSCYYVRTLGGIPRVFAEYVEGGSLKDWIDSKKLYEGSPAEALKRILDVAIQFAWGLQYAHEKGLVHRDVKPANVMMAPDGEVKVTDFGLAKARAVLGDVAGSSAPQDILVSSGAMTPAYCSPEQASKQLLSLKTDIWSWGLSILEMFAGEVFWAAGQAAPEALASYLETGAEDTAIPKMPESVAELLKRWFQRNHDDRPKDMQEIVSVLESVYGLVAGEDYPRQEPKAAELLADSLNNRALSYLEMEQPKRAEALWEEALKADPHHPESTYNRGLLEWRSGRLTDVSLVQQLNQARGTYPRATHLLGLVHLERGDVEAALSSLKEAQQTDPDNLAVNAAINDATQLASTIRPVSRTLTGNGPITGVIFCSGGQTLLSASGLTLRKWAVGPATCLDVLSVPAKDTFVFAASPSGRIAVTAGKEQALCVWDFDSGNCRHALQDPIGSITCVAVHPSGSACISAGTNGILNVWDLDTGECTHTLRGHGGAISSVAFCNDGHLALSAGADGILRVWDWNTKTCCRVLERPAARVSVIVAHNEMAMLGTLGGMIELWDVIAGKCLGTLSGHTGVVLSVSISTSGLVALSTSMDDTVRLWDLQHGRCVRTLEARSTHAGALSPDAGLMVWGEASKSVLASWDIRVASTACSAGQPLAISRPKPSATVYCDEERVRQLQVRAELECASGGAQGAYDAATEMLRVAGHERDRRALEIIARVGRMGRRTRVRDGWPARVFQGHEAPVACATFSPDARAIVSAGWDGAVRVWDSKGEKPTRVFRDHVGPVSSVAVSMGGLVVVSAGWDGTLRFRSVALKVDLGGLVAPNEPVSAMAVSDDHRCAVTGGGSLALANDLQAHKQDSDRLKFIWAGLTHSAGSAAAIKDAHPRCATDYNMRVWDLVSGKCLHELPGHTGQVRNIAMTRDSRCAISAGEDGSVRMWDLVSGWGLVVAGKLGRVFGVALTPDETRVWAALEWGTVAEIDLARCQTLRGMRTKLRADGISVKGVEHATAVAVSFDGRSIAAGYQDGTIRIWGADNGECELVLRGHTGWVSKLDFSRDNRWLVSAGGDCTVRLWELLSDFDFPETADWDDGARELLGIFLACYSRDRKGVLAPFGKPAWSPRHFEALILELQYRGYGWLRPEGVRKKLQEMAANWQGPPPAPGKPASPQECVVPAESPSSQAGETNSVGNSPPAPADAKTVLKRPRSNEVPAPPLETVPQCQRARDAPAQSPGRACQQCGARVATGLCFCTQCGNPVSDRERAQTGLFIAEARDRMCSCDFRNESRSAFCNQCGKQLSPVGELKCPACQKVLPPGVSFCTNCGRRLAGGLGP
jgi:WD40 repeat protein/serine/threonine protein kinase